MTDNAIDQRRQYVRNTARHEVAHHLAADAVGHVVGAISVTAGYQGAPSGHSASSPKYTLDTIEDVLRFALERIVVCLAGCYAECFDKEETYGLLAKHGVFDNERIKENALLVQLIRAGRGKHSSLDEILDECFDRVAAILTPQKAKIENVASAMASRVFEFEIPVTMTAEEVAEIQNDFDDSEAGSD